MKMRLLHQRKKIRVVALENIANMTDNGIKVYSKGLWQKLINQMNELLVDQP